MAAKMPAACCRSRRIPRTGGPPASASPICINPTQRRTKPMKQIRKLTTWLSLLLVALVAVGALTVVWADEVAAPAAAAPAAAPEPTPDPNGGNTGNAGNVTAA